MRDEYQNNRPVIDLAVRQALPQRTLHDASFRSRALGLLLMLLLVVVGVYLFMHTNEQLERLQARIGTAENADTARISLYNQKLEALQDRMSVFVADSVETKLNTLERSVGAGTVGAQEIRTLEELKGEVQLLAKYSAGKGGNFTDQSKMDHARFQIIPAMQNNAGGDLLYEISQMKRLLYFGIASCGLVGFLLGGMCWHGHSRVKRLAHDLPKQRLLASGLERDV